MTFDTKRKFGVEVEFISVHTQSSTVSKINAYLDEHNADFNVETAYYSDTSNTWRIKTDSSIQEGYDYGLELVTPVLQGQADYERLVLVLDAINSIDGVRVNRSTGLHIHVGVEDWKVSNFKNLVKRYAKFEKVLDSIMPESRRMNNGSYCRSNFNSRYSLKDIYNEIDDKDSTRTLISSASSGRYVKLNLQSFWKHGTVEFRHHSGTTNSTKISNWLRVVMAMVECADARRSVKVATDDSVYDNDYTLTTFFNGLAKVSDLIDRRLRVFYNTRARRVA